MRKIGNQQRLFLTSSVLMLCLGIVGCGGGPKVVKISGTVTCGGQPVKDLTVHFVPDVGRPSWGYTDPEGRFTLHYTKDRDGAVTGKHRVHVQYEPKDIETYTAITEGRFEYPPNIKAIQEKYGDQKTTPLTFDIQESQKIELKLD